MFWSSFTAIPSLYAPNFGFIFHPQVAGSIDFESMLKSSSFQDADCLERFKLHSQRLFLVVFEFISLSLALNEGMLELFIAISVGSF